MNIAGSAWYLRPNRFDHRDNTLCSNHRLGLYYTWLEETRVHALFFNYQPAVFLVIASKVAHLGVLAPTSYRRGPQLTKTFVWGAEKSVWVEQAAVEDGFSTIVGESGRAKDDIKRIADVDVGSQQNASLRYVPVRLIATIGTNGAIRLIRV